MDSIIRGFLERNVPLLKDSIEITLTGGEKDCYTLRARDGRIFIEANAYVPAFHGLYEYLKKYCGVQLSWCGNRKITVSEPVMFDGVMEKVIEQKYRVYMNYCTLDYSMCWWSFEHWEREIDFMAMNGVNMPLCVPGTEAVWYETLLDFGFTKDEALSTVSGPAFWAWQLMTNIEGYFPPEDEGYIYRRLELGKKILERVVQFGMFPIQQGFSGHVPVLMVEKYPDAKIKKKMGWNLFPKTAQLDPLDPLFRRFGTAYLQKLEKLMGNFHFLACDPFHEGVPPKLTRGYLNKVGKSIDGLYSSFDPDSVWVMQGWTPYPDIIRAVPRDRLLILDLNSARTPLLGNFWGYPVVAGMLHNFGGKNAMQGKIRHHCENAYKTLKDGGANTVGTGMFPEGIAQNPAVYDLQFHMLTQSGKIDFDEWIRDYIKRRYGKFSERLYGAWQIMLDTCYADSGYAENRVGSALASRPQPMPVRSGPCCKTKLWYDPEKLERALSLFLSEESEYGNSDGYQYDLCDLARQVLSNRFYVMQKEFAVSYRKNDLERVKKISEKQLELLDDLDRLLSHRSEMCLATWICDCHDIASDEKEKRRFELNARTLITVWGYKGGSTAALYDYSWREWSGLIGEYYRVRWQMFYDEVINTMENGKKPFIINLNGYVSRLFYRSTPLGKKLERFELNYGTDYREYERPVDSDVIPEVKDLVRKWKI